MITLNIVFSTIYYLELHHAYIVVINVKIYQVKMLMFYNVQIANLTLLANEIHNKQL